MEPSGNGADHYELVVDRRDNPPIVETYELCGDAMDRSELFIARGAVKTTIFAVFSNGDKKIYQETEGE